MRILLISAFPPSKHNLGYPSALPYYLSKYKPDNFEIDLIYYEGFEDKENYFLEDIDFVFSKVIKVGKIKKHKYYALKGLQKLFFNQIFKGNYLHHTPDAKTIKYVRKQNYDLVWLYPNMLYNWYKAIDKFKVLLTGPDCSYLHYNLVTEKYSNNSIELTEHMLQHPQIKNLKKLKSFSYNLEKKWSLSKALIHVVGKSDLKMYEKLGAGDHAFFSIHPYYVYKEIEKPINETTDKITILISGVNNSIYIGDFWNRITLELIKKNSLKDNFKFLFIGKDFEASETLLKEAGYQTSLFNWVESYEECISTAQVQIFPIILGTGTKGKVLSALVSGLLSIGTAYAFENINVDSNDCVLVEDEKDVIDTLVKIVAEKAKYNTIAKSGSEKVKFSHSPNQAGKDFWGYIIENYIYSK